MTSEPVTADKDSTKLIAGIVGLAIVAAGLFTYEWRSNTFGLFQTALDDARASLAVGDTQSAEQLYLDHIKNNLKDSEARIELIELLTSQARTEDALPIASQLVRDFPTQENAQKYREIVQTIHEHHDLIAQDALREKDKETFIDASMEAQNALLLSPKIAFPTHLASDDSNLKIFVENDSADCLGSICTPHSFQSEEMHAIAHYVSYEAYKETELAFTFESGVTDVLRPGAMASRAINAFPSGLVTKHFGSKFVFQDFVELIVAEALYELAKRLPIGKHDVALQRCIDLTDSLGINVNDLMKRQKRGLYRACMSHKLRLAVESFNPEQVATVLNDWKYGANRLCGLNSESGCHQAVRMFSWGIYQVSDEEQTTSSFFEPVGEFIMDVVDPLYQNENESDLRDLADLAFEKENWGEAARLYSALGHFQELYGKDRSWGGPPTSELIAENKYNAAMALWNDDRRADSIALLETITEDYPDYGNAKLALVDFRAIYERRPSKAALIAYDSLLSIADRLSDEDDYEKTAIAYVAASEEYQKAVGKSAPYPLARAYFFFKSAGQFSTATRYLEAAFSADPNYKFDSGLSVADLRSQWALELPYKKSLKRASDSFDDRQWLSAYSGFIEAEKYALDAHRSGKFSSSFKPSAAESAANAAISLINADQWRRARTLFQRVRREYPDYDPLLISEKIREIDNACPNQYLGC